MQTYAAITDNGTYNLLGVSELAPVLLDITGDFEGGTVAIKKCSTHDGTYTALLDEGSDVSYTAADNPVLYLGGVFLQVEVSGATSPDITIKAAGRYVFKHPTVGLVS